MSAGRASTKATDPLGASNRLHHHSNDDRGTATVDHENVTPLVKVRGPGALLVRRIQTCLLVLCWALLLACFGQSASWASSDAGDQSLPGAASGSYSSAPLATSVVLVSARSSAPSSPSRASGSFVIHSSAVSAGLFAAEPPAEPMVVELSTDDRAFLLLSLTLLVALSAAHLISGWGRSS